MAESLVCDVCGKAATVHLTQIINNQIQKVDLCESCAQAKGVEDASGFSLTDFLTSNIQASSPQAAPQISEASNCPQCHWSADDLKKQGRLGCAQCYDAHHDLVLSVIKGTQFGLVHRGKIPACAGQRLATQQQVAQLALDLEKAVASEQFEQAAKLRDCLQAIQQGKRESSV